MVADSCVDESTDNAPSPVVSVPIAVARETVDVATPRQDAADTNGRRVTVERAATRTHRFEVTHGEQSHAAPLELLHRMAAREHPLSYDARMARQALSHNLSLPPEVYNIQRFGEIDAPRPITAPSNGATSPPAKELQNYRVAAG